MVPGLVQGGPSPGRPGLGWLWFGMFHHLVDLLRHLCQFFSSAQEEVGRGRDSTNQSQTNPGSPGDGSTCTVIFRVLSLRTAVHRSPLLWSGRREIEMQCTSRLDRYVKSRRAAAHINKMVSTGWPISWRTWVGLTLIWKVPPAGSRYCSYLLPKQDGGTSQI